jgi:hypothetical protein
LSIVDVGILVAGALLGWLAVSFVITVVRQQREPPVVLQGGSTRSPAEEAGTRRVSLRQLAETWHTVLGVQSDASLEQIEAAYHQRIAECERAGASQPTAGVGKEEGAEQQRFLIEEAYGFIRTSRR